jgi:hypothetical protein
MPKPSKKRGFLVANAQVARNAKEQSSRYVDSDLDSVKDSEERLALLVVDSATSTADKATLYEQFVAQKQNRTDPHFDVDADLGSKRSRSDSNSSARDIDLDWELVAERAASLLNKGSQQYEASVSQKLIFTPNSIFLTFIWFCRLLCWCVELCLVN